MIRKKHRAWNRYIETKNPAKLAKFKQIRNIVATEINKLRAHEQYVISISCKENPQKIWKYANSKRNTKGGIGNLVQVDETGHETTANNDWLKAEVLCKSFSSVFTSESALNGIDSNTSNNDISDMDD